MGNFCSIFHSRFKHLMQVIPSARKAQLMDYILLGWQTSIYKLKGSDKKWFMKPYSEIVNDTGIPQSTLERYIKELSDAGFIERRQALYSRTKEQGVFEVKKGAYIHITEKLLFMLKPVQTSLETTPPNLGKDNHNDGESDKQHPDIPNTQLSTCSDSGKNEGIDPLKMRGSYISDLYPSLNNNITFRKLTRSVDKPTLERLMQQFESIQKLLYSDIKEEIPHEVKKLVSGTFFNLTFEHKKQLSSPKQVVAEYLYALLNVEFYLPEAACFKHRNNILSKIIRSSGWRTPKGFYKHFYLGQGFKDKQELHEQHWQEQKENEIKHSKYSMDFIAEKDGRWMQLEAKMIEKSALISQLTNSLYQQSSEEMILTIRENIQCLKSELETLWQEQLLIEQSDGHQPLCGAIKRCA